MGARICSCVMSNDLEQCFESNPMSWWRSGYGIGLSGSIPGWGAINFDDTSSFLTTIDRDRHTGCTKKVTPVPCTLRDRIYMYRAMRSIAWFHYRASACEAVHSAMSFSYLLVFFTCSRLNIISLLLFTDD